LPRARAYGERVASKGGLTAAPIAVLCMLFASPAQGATTRAEWVAQVEPICQASLPAATAANNAVNKKFKTFAHVAKFASDKAFVRATRSLAHSIQAYTAIDDNLTNQLAGIAPVPIDAGAVSNWLQGRRDTTALANRAAAALLRFKARKFFRLLDEANAAYSQAVSSVSGFGLNACLNA
jgi:hypothetical protein